MGKCSDLEIWILIPILSSIIVTVSGFGIQTSYSRSTLFQHEHLSSASLLNLQQRQPAIRTTRLYTQDHSKVTTNEDKTTSEREQLSDLDARVLRSIMEGDDLDLKTEENMKKLLERGTFKSTKEATTEQKIKSKDSDFKSDFLQVRAFCWSLFLYIFHSPF